jgi:hypothetical protein
MPGPSAQDPEPPPRAGAPPRTRPSIARLLLVATLSLVATAVLFRLVVEAMRRL